MEIRDCPVLVTGAASGLGRATAERLARLGGRVAIFDIQGSPDASMPYFNVDVTQEDSVREAIAAAEAQHGVARILVNCAGIAPAMKTVGRDAKPHSLESFRKAVEVNLIGNFNLISQFAARLSTIDPIGEERGVIVNTASVAAYDGQIGQAAYAASKAGVVGLTLPVARDLAQHRIRVMTIAPGLFLTPMTQSFTQEVRDALGAQVPHPARLGQPEEYAQLVEAIICNPMLNGEVIRLDGAIRMAPR